MDKLRLPAELADARVGDVSREQLVALLEAGGGDGIRITFVGKNNARRLARKVRPRTTKTVPSLGTGTAEQRAANLLIEGDNLQAMVTLYRWRGGIDLILADPPYNTGNDFRYNDKWEDDPNDAGLGEFVSADDGARHTKWMRFMWPRLQLMKSMLKPGGVLAICIDYREMFRLGQMLDELFGENNRLGIINWQRTYTVTNDADHVATTTEYVLVYAKSEKKTLTQLLPRESDGDAAEEMPDGDPVPWTDAPATGSNAKAHKAMVYGIQSPFTGELLYPPPGSAWRQGQDRNLEQLQEWGVRFVLRDCDDAAKRAELIGVPVEEVPDVKAIVLAGSVAAARKKVEKRQAEGPWPKFYFLSKGKGRPRLKKYLHELQPGFVPRTYWADDDIDVPELGQTVVDVVSWPHPISGHSQQGVNELTAIVGPGHEFKTVKPVKLFKKLCQIWLPKDGVVLDPFAGSGTTGHAVLDLNAEDEGSRRFILIEQGRPERGDSYARTLTKDRLKRVITGEWVSKTTAPRDAGFTFVRLGKRVDATALLQMERDEMVDTVIASHFDANRRRGDQLIRLERQYKPYQYLVARNADNEGFFLVWDGSSADFSEPVYERCAEEAENAGVKMSPFHVYARLYRFQAEGVRFYQIPDRILADFGLDIRSEPFAEDEDGDDD
jgi:adenine-specific DNA-methyltransferase